MPTSTESLAGRIATLGTEQRGELFTSLSDAVWQAMSYHWPFWARPKQLPPEGDWTVWLLMAGRGFGKTRTGAEWVREQVESGGARHIALVGRTAADVRDVMVEGDSGVLNVFPPWKRPDYQPGNRKITFHNGATAHTYSADKPDQLRGPQHDAAWADEVAAWQYAEAWQNLMLGLRGGQDPRCVATTTPKPVRVVRDLIDSDTCVVTRGSTFENAPNLAEPFLDQIVGQYEGTRLARQELHGELLEDVPGALWNRDLIESGRTDKHPPLDRIVVAIDPAVTSGEESDETGIVAAGKAGDEAYVLADKSTRTSPDQWARRAVALFGELRADRVVAEVNNGGDLVERVIRTVDMSVPYRAVHATRGKRVRAEPVSALYEQGRVHHVGGFPDLEDQMCLFAPDEYDGSPDRVDALVWALTELLVDTPHTVKVGP